MGVILFISGRGVQELGQRLFIRRRQSDVRLRAAYNPEVLGLIAKRQKQLLRYQHMVRDVMRNEFRAAVMDAFDRIAVEQ